MATITMLDAAIALRSLVVTGGGEGGTTMTRFRDHDDEHLRRAIELAREARTRGNVPFGSVLVGEAGATLAEGRNTVTTERDAPGHVETNLLRAAFRSLDAQALASSALHSIAEPRASRASAGARPDPLTRSPTAGALLLDNLTKEQSTSTALEERSARHGRRIRRHARSDIGHAEAVAGVASYAASAQALAFAAVHLYWALGGTVGLPKGISVDMNPALFVIDVLAVPLCVVGALLALSLVRPWGRLFPRRFLLACAWGVCALLVFHAAPTLIWDGLVAAGLREANLSVLERWSLFVYEPWFFMGGVLYGVAAWGYGRRLSRPGPAGPDRRCCDVQGETFGVAKE